MPLDSTALRLNFRSKQPVTEQIADFIRLKIQTGDCKAGESLPAVRELAQQLKINFNTVARAYRALDFEGYLSAQQGRGTFVLPAEERAMINLQDQAPEIEIVRKILREASDAGLTLDQLVAVLLALKTDRSRKPEGKPGLKKKTRLQRKPRTYFHYLLDAPKKRPSKKPKRAKA